MVHIQFRPRLTQLLVLAAWGALPVAAQTVTTVNWAGASTGSPVCPNQLYQQGGGSLSALNPRTVNWDPFVTPAPVNGSTAYNGYAYAPERGVAFATVNDGANTASTVRIGQVTATGASTVSAQFTAVDAGTATFTNPANTSQTATYTTTGNGAYAAGGYDEVRHMFWTVRALSPNVFYVYDMDVPLMSNPVAANFSPRQIRVDFGTNPGKDDAYPRALPQMPWVYATSTGNDGGAQFTDVMVLGNKVYAISMNSLFVYEFQDGSDINGRRSVTPVRYYRVRLDNIAGNQFPKLGTFGAQWLAKSPSGKPVIYASLNDNAFITTTTPTAGYPGGSLFRIENIDSPTPIARQEIFKSLVVSGGDGFNCSGADGLWLLEVADDVNYTPVNTPVTGSWIANDNLHAAGLASAPGSLIATGGSETKPTTQGGSIVMRQDGTYTYTPAPGFTGVDTYEYTVCDSFAATGEGMACRTATITIYVDGPVGQGLDDADRTPLNTPVTIDVLSNDVFPKPATPVVSTTPPANGTVAVNPDGTVTYTPSTGFTGTDSFTYTTTDALGTPHTQTVTVVVGPLGAAPDRYTTSPGTPFTTTAVTTAARTSTPLTELTSPAGNDVYPAGSTFTQLTPLPAGQGTISGYDATTGGFSYDPQGFAGTTSFSYQVCQPTSPTVCAPSTVTIVVPGAVNDNYATAPNTPLLGASVAVNDTAPIAGSTFETTGTLSNPAAGSLAFRPDGTFDFAPAAGFAGTVTFPYKLCLPRPDETSCATAVATIVVPGATNDSYSTPHNTAVGGNVGQNDGMPAGSSFALTGALSNPAAGALTFNADGSFNFVPANGFSGPVSFPYQACLPSPHQTVCAPATATITVAPATPAPLPVGQPDTQSTPMNTPVVVSVLSNDTGNSLVVTGTSTPANGSVTIGPGTGAVTYTPNPGFSGTDTFTYTARDGNGNSYTQTVTVTVSPITAQNDSYVALAGVTMTGNAAANDSYPTGSTFKATGPLSNPAAGTLGALDPATGTFSFTPAAGFSGTVSFPYEVCQANGAACAKAVVTILVPGASNDSYTTPPGQTLTGQVGGNDAVPAGSSFTATGPLSNPAAGTLSFNPDGSFSFVPAPGFSGTVSFPYQVCLPAPNQTVCPTATATITVGSVTPVPVDSGWALFGAALGLLGLAGRRRRLQ